MTFEEFKDNVSFDGLKKKIDDSPWTRAQICSCFRINATVLSNTFSGYSLPNSDVLAKFCSLFECSICDLVEFKGYEIKEEFREPYFRTYEPDFHTGISYEPLRQYFKSKDEVHWRDLMDEFFSRVEKLELNKNQQESVSKLISSIPPRIKTGKKPRSPFVQHPGGLISSTRYKLRHDEPVQLKIIYCICRTLGCTPDYVMSYK